MKKKNLILLAVAAGAYNANSYAQQNNRNSKQDIYADKTLQEVVVTATGTGHLLKNVPVQTEVISRKMIESYGGKSIEDILEGLTASFSFNEGDMGSKAQLGGLGNNYILILIDGKRIHGDNGGENDLGLIDPNNIERIEIVKGAQSALYGSDAMAGVINIITKKHDTHAEGHVLKDSRNKTVNKFTNWQISENITYNPTKNLELYANGYFYRKIINRPTNGNYASCDVYTYDLL